MITHMQPRYTMCEKIFFIFLLSFFLNVLWEHMHSYLYAGYMGGAITEGILLRASIVDASIIAILSLPFVCIAVARNWSWIIIVIGVLIAVAIELYALHTGRWAYNEYMPVIPLLSIGVTPTIQLGLLGYLSYWLVVGRK